uniref:G-protein coupled receptors family 1 profile domain-containing protein n=1 Tax=Podarcis muralis TaxID=64176 RepID=A0A670HTL2_PODMU
MLASNWTLLHPSTFILVGIPGLQDVQIWISIPFCCLYILTLLGNCLLLVVVKREPSLHEPMYLFLCMLAGADLVVTTTIVPKILSIFWFGHGSIHINGCLAQIFLLHSFSTMESGFILAMAFDRYMAICNPHPFLLKWLPYCRGNVILHTYCEFMALMKLTCVDTGAERAYSLLVAFLTGGLDLVLIIVSYILIFQAVFQLPSKEARVKSLGTCGSHACVILVFYTPAFFSFLTHRFGHVAAHVHILVANIYLLLPPMMNPIIYGVRTKRIQQGLFKIFCVKTR